MRQAIQDRLAKLAEAHSVRIIMACESGSRAWGFPSRDSDYDARFLYLHDLDWYLSVEPGRDVIEEDDGLFDLGGWDLRKALMLLRRSNAALIEWLCSPIRYQQEPELVAPVANLVTRAFRPRTVSHHYLAILRRQLAEIRGDGPIRLKSYCYAIRSLLAARHVIETMTPPPMDLPSLLASADRSGEPLALGTVHQINQLVELKSRSLESDRTDRLDRIDSLLLDGFSDLDSRLPAERPKIDRGGIDAAFRQVLRRAGELPAEAHHG